MVTGDADWSVETAEEEAQLRRALDLNEGPELVGLETCLLLAVVEELVRNGCLVVAHSTTHRNRYVFAFATYGVRQVDFGSSAVTTTGNTRHGNQEKDQE